MAYDNDSFESDDILDICTKVLSNAINTIVYA